MSSNETTLKCKPKRYLWIDNLKMFACLLVVIGHGMTYHEDVAAVKDSFKKMLENGVYKADLFSDL